MKKKTDAILHEAATPGAPDLFERYTEEFDSRTGMGGMEVWVPIKACSNRNRYVGTQVKKRVETSVET